MPYLSTSGFKIEKVLSYFQHPQICQNAKFCAKLKIIVIFDFSQGQGSAFFLKVHLF